MTALHLAAQNGHESVVGLLLDRRASINATDKDRQTPLHLAALNGNESVVGLLLDRGASLNAPDRQTPLHLAARRGHESVVGLLLDRGASVNATDKDRQTPLHLAAVNGNGPIVGLLLDRGASIDATTKKGQTPLHYAARAGYESVVGLLLDRGADTTIVSVRPCLFVVAALVASKSPSLMVVLRQIFPQARGTAAQVAQTPSLKQFIGAHSILLFALLTRLSLSLSLSCMIDSQPPILHLIHQSQPDSYTIVVMVDRPLSLGGGRTPVNISLSSSVGTLKQAIHRQCAIPSPIRTLLLNNNLEPLQHDDQSLYSIGITDRSSLFITLQGTLSKSFCLFLFLFIIIVTIVVLMYCWYSIE